MSLNLPQPVKLGRRPGRKVGSDPKKVEKCLVLVLEAVNTRGSVPTNGELASALGCTHPTVISIWRALVAAGVKCGRLEWNSVCNWPNKVNVVNWSYVMTMRAIADFPQVLL